MDERRTCRHGSEKCKACGVPVGEEHELGCRFLLQTVRVFEAEDGYTFYLQPDGSLTDNLDPEKADMAYASLEDLKAVCEVKEVTFGEPEREVWPGNDPVMKAFAEWGEKPESE